MDNHKGLISRADATGIPLLLARLFVGCVMVTMSIPKIQQPVEFLKGIRLYGLVPEEWSMVLNLIAVLVPWIELLGGVALILGVALRGTGAVFTLMLIGFTTVVSLRAYEFVQAGTPFFRVEFDCGCGTGVELIWTKLLMNLGLILASMVVFASGSRRLCLSTLLRTRAQPQAA